MSPAGMYAEVTSYVTQASACATAGVIVVAQAARTSDTNTRQVRIAVVFPWRVALCSRASHVSSRLDLLWVEK